MCIPLGAQIEDPLLRDTMTLAQAKYALQQQMATIEYYYYQNYYDKDIKRAADNYYYSFTRATEPFRLLPEERIVEKILNKKWRSFFDFTNRGRESELYIRHDFSGEDINENKLRPSYLFPHRSLVKKVFYANGTVESDPIVLNTEEWYRNRKPIDSILVDATIVYPASIEVLKMSVLEAQKVDLDTGGFIWLINNDGKRLSLAITENVARNMGALHVLTNDGKRFGNSRGVYVPYQPSTEMYIYASAVYQHCAQLIGEIDRGTYNSVNSLIDRHQKNKPIPPAIKKVNRYSCRIPNNSDSLEITYYSTLDSVSMLNMMIRQRSSRKCDYGIASMSTGDRILYGLVDLDGNWVVRPSLENDYFEEVAGVFYKEHDSDYSRENARLLRVNEKAKKLEPTIYEVFEVFDDTFLLVEEDNEQRGILHRNGNVLLPTKFKNIVYDSGTRYFIAQQDTRPSTYKLFNEKGEDLLTKAYRSIEIRDNRIHTTEVIDGIEKYDVYDK
jgi:hypothetical protein